MILIIEGMDNTGKDTLIEKIQSNFSHIKRPHLVLKFSAIKNLSFQRHKEAYMKLYEKTFNLFKTEQDVILNRFCLGEEVYSPIYRNYFPDGLIEKIKQSKIDYPDIFNKICMIVLIDEPDNLLKREDGLSLSNKDIELMQKEKELFINAYEKSEISNKYILNISNKDEDQVFLELKKFIGRYYTDQLNSKSKEKK